MIILKSPDEINKMRRSNMIVHEVLTHLAEIGKPGITGEDMDRIAEEMIRKRGGIPTFIGYMGFPKTLCISPNEKVVHGIPNKTPFKEGDIVGIDCGVTLDGFVGDSAVTLAIGKVSREAQALMDITKAGLEAGIAEIKVGNRVNDIGHAVQTLAESNGYGVVREFVGHGVGRKMHEPPQVPNYGKAGTGDRLKVGMVLAIEPMIAIGSGDVEVLGDKWTVVTKDRTLSAHFEHSVALTDKGAWVLSRP